jgi:hypothetical protein
LTKAKSSARPAAARGSSAAAATVTVTTVTPLASTAHNVATAPPLPSWLHDGTARSAAHAANMRSRWWDVPTNNIGSGDSAGPSVPPPPPPPPPLEAQAASSASLSTALHRAPSSESQCHGAPVSHVLRQRPAKDDSDDVAHSESPPPALPQHQQHAATASSATAHRRRGRPREDAMSRQYARRAA